MSKGPLLALGIVLALAAGVGALLFVGGGGPRGEGDDAAPESGAGETAPRPVDGSPPAAERSADESGLAVAAVQGTGAVRVRVLDGTTRVPVEGVPVSLDGRSGAGARVSTSVRTGPDGDALLGGVPAGDAYALRASPAGARPVERRDVAVAEGETTDLGVLFTGAHGVVEGVVVDDDGNPVERADVSASAEPERLVEERSRFPRVEPFARPVATATTGADGRFRLEEVPTGLVAIRAHAEGRRTAIDRVVVERRPEPVVRRLVLTRGVVLRGEVVDGAGTGVPGVQVVVSAARDPRRSETLRTDERGRFELAGFGATRVDLEIVLTPPDGWPVAYSSIQRVDEPLRFVLDGGAKLEVTVIDVHTTQPIRDAEVRHARGASAGAARPEPSSEVRARTDAKGVAVLDLRPGTKPAPRVTAEGFRATDKFEGDVTRPLAERETRSLRIFLRRPTVVFGRVTWKDGSGARSLSVLLARPKSTIGKAMTDSAGDYRISNVPPVSDGSLAVLRPERDPFTVPVPTITGEEAGVRVDVHLPEDPPVEEGQAGRGPTASVRGRVLDGMGEPLPGARVVTGARSVWTDATGSFHVPEAPVLAGQRPVDSSYVPLTVTADGFLTTASIQVPANAGDTVVAKDVWLSIGSTAKGIVVGPGGKPVAFARVWLQGSEWPDGAGTAADGGGVFALSGVPGRWAKVWASGPRSLGVAVVDTMAPARPPVVTLRPVVDASGRVTTFRGGPVEGARVSLVFPQGARDVLLPERELTNVATGPEGEFRVYSSSEGTPSLQVWARGWPTKTVAIPTTEGPLEIVLGP